MYVTCTVLRHRPRMASPARFGNRCCANRWSLNRMGSRPCHEPFFVMNDRFVRRSILRRRFLFSWLLGDFGIVWRYYGEHGDLSVRLPVALRHVAVLVLCQAPATVQRFDIDLRSRGVLYVHFSKNCAGPSEPQKGKVADAFQQQCTRQGDVGSWIGRTGEGVHPHVR